MLGSLKPELVLKYDFIKMLSLIMEIYDSFTQSHLFYCYYIFGVSLYLINKVVVFYLYFKHFPTQLKKQPQCFMLICFSSNL